jgi:PAS domain S-box-containing protein
LTKITPRFSNSKSPTSSTAGKHKKVHNSFAMETRKELIREPSILQSLFEHSAAALMVVDRDNCIQMVNKEMEHMTGYGREDMEGRLRWCDMVLAEDRDVLKNLLRRLKADGPGSHEKYECRFLNREGNLKTAYLSGALVRKTGHLVLSLIDITDQKEYEYMLRNAKSKAEASDRLKTAFLGNLSHEIRTPMNAIVGFASLLQNQELTEDKKKLYLAQIVSGSSDLLQLIEKTIVISRIDLGQIKISPREFHVNKRLAELHSRYRQILDDTGKEGIELVLEPGRNEDDFVIQADAIRIMEVLNNLLENAVKFTGNGKITLGYTCLKENGDDGYDSLLFYVKDTGPGIPKDKTGVIFDRFVKLLDKNESVLRGAGLGLAISHDLVKLMGGNIWVETGRGKGSRFFFTIPLILPKAGQTDKSFVTPEKEYADWSKHTIMVAEDVESNYLYIKELLSPTHIKILRARDGFEAVEIYEKNPEIDIILMDILMPGLDGYEATAKIRTMRKEVPVIAQTAFTFEGEVRDGLYAGCFNDYLMKPFSREILLANLKKYLAGAK